MSVLKDEILQLVATIDDENLLELVKADIEYFRNKETDILDELNATDKKELIDMLNEADEKDTISEEEFKAATAKWRIK